MDPLRRPETGLAPIDYPFERGVPGRLVGERRTVPQIDPIPQMRHLSWPNAR